MVTSPKRKQLSLIIRDEDLYNNLIKPYGDSGELNDLIIKCLSAYYYRDEARAVIDEVEKSEEASNGIKSTQDMIQDIRQALAMQSFLAESLQDTVEDGMEDISDVLTRTTEKAEEDGLFKTEQSEFGGVSTRITMKMPAQASDDFQDLSKLTKEMLDSASKGDYRAAFANIAKEQEETRKERESMAKKLDSILELLLSRGVDVSELQKQVVIQEPTSEEPVAEEQPKEEASEPKDDKIDGSEALDSLLSGLHF